MDTAPTNFDLGTFTAPVLFSAEEPDVLTVNYTNTDDWAIAVGGYLLLFAGQPQNAGRSFYRGPWRYCGKVSGAVVPPESPEEATAPFALTEGQKVWMMARVIQIDGRISLPIILGPAVVASA